MIQSYKFIGVEGIEEGKIRQRIRRLRRMILVHSCLYYGYNENIISDAEFDELCRELVGLQERRPLIARSVEFYQTFEKFDGSSGYNLDYKHPEIMKIAEYLRTLNKDRMVYK